MLSKDLKFVGKFFQAQKEPKITQVFGDKKVSEELFRRISFSAKLNEELFLRQCLDQYIKIGRALET